MKTIALDQLDPRMGETLEQQDRQHPILLTKGSDAIGLLLKLPEGTKDSDVDAVLCMPGSEGHILVIVEAKHDTQVEEPNSPGQPVFGSCKGLLTILSDDDEHLKDFAEYMP